MLNQNKLLYPTYIIHLQSNSLIILVQLCARLSWTLPYGRSTVTKLDKINLSVFVSHSLHNAIEYLYEHNMKFDVEKFSRVSFKITFYIIIINKIKINIEIWKLLVMFEKCFFFITYRQLSLSVMPTSHLELLFLMLN